MNIDKRKNIFLIIIKNWFKDSTNDINEENCIQFYHHLLNCLEFESKYSQYSDMPEFKTFLLLTIDYLNNFPEYISADKNNIYLIYDSLYRKQYFCSFLLNNPKREKHHIDIEVGYCFSNLIDMYKQIKEEFVV